LLLRSFQPTRRSGPVPNGAKRSKPSENSATTLHREISDPSNKAGPLAPETTPGTHGVPARVPEVPSGGPAGILRCLTTPPQASCHSLDPGWPADPLSFT
jgi:hypothetical protein